MKSDLSKSFKEHAFAFVDILGFSELVARFDEDPSLIEKIYPLVAKTDQEDVSGLFADRVFDGSAKLTVVSDSVFFSVPCSVYEKGFHSPRSAAVSAVVSSVYWLQRWFLRKGILTRGGVSIGNLLHNKKAVFGSALINAYRVESTLAINPRVVLDDLALEAARTDTIGANREDIFGRWTRCDSDGLFFIDYLRWNAGEDFPLQSKVYREIAAGIESAIQTVPDNRSRQKVLWLANYFNSSIQAHRDGDELFAPYIPEMRSKMRDAFASIDLLDV